MKHITPILVILLLVSSGFVGVSVIPSVPSEQISTGDVITVDDEGDGDYTSIKEAVNNSNPGDTIEVYSGTYYEHGIEIHIENVTLKGISYELGNGSDTGKPFIDGQGKAKVIRLMAEGVTISGFHIENGGGTHAYSIMGISDDAHNCVISDNDISNTFMACIGVGSNNNKILNNTISHSYIRQGIVVGDGARNNLISGNTISDIGTFGIDLWGSHHTLVSYNKISRCNLNGIDIVGDFNTIYRNHIEDNDVGLRIGDSIFNIIIQNNFINNLLNAYCGLGFGFYPGFSNRWFNNYWDNWNGIGPKRIPGTILLFIPRPNFDWRPAQEPFDIGGSIG